MRSPSGTQTEWNSDPGGASGDNAHPFAATKFFSSIGFEESLLLYEVSAPRVCVHALVRVHYSSLTDTCYGNSQASEKLHVAAGDVIFRQVGKSTCLPSPRPYARIYVLFYWLR